MANYKVTDTELTSIANAIRTKGGTQAQLEFPQGFIDAINAISGGGGGGGGGGGVTIVSWASGSDADVAAMIDAAQAGTIDLQQDGGWAVGDVRTIQISAFTGGGSTAHAAQSIDIVISSFDDYESCGAVMQFDFVDELAKDQRMNGSNTNNGGYDASEMFTTTLPALVAALPEWLRTRLVEFSCKAGAGSGSTTVETITGNKLALRSEWEVFGSKSYADAGASGAEASEAKQIAYYATSGHRVKKRGHSGSAGGWWLRSPRSSILFCYVDSNGSASSFDAYGTTGLAPFGCI